MGDVGRNDPCPCASGRKHKRCCLEPGRTALRLAGRLEDRIDELGEQVRREHLPVWRSEFERNIAAMPRLGGIPAEEAAWLDTWLVCHATVMDGRTPLDASEHAGAADTHLAESSICGWWARGTGPPIPATHWRIEAPLVLHCRHEPLGELRDGALLVARGVDTGPGHVALLGRPVVVDDDAVGEVLALLHSAPDQALCAALRWPEERTCTADGELVQQRFRRYELHDPDAAVALLRATPGMSEDADVLTYREDDVEFEVAGAAIAEITQPPTQPGVVWTLCEEDTTDPPMLGEITVSREDRELALNAPTQQRLERLVAALPAELRLSLGEITHEEIDLPEVMPRVRRERIADLFGGSLPTAHALGPREG